MKYSQWFGVISAILMIVGTFLPWTWYPDIQKVFTGFYSEDNMYGRPGKALVFFAVLITIFYLIPRVWAKRWNLFFCSLNLAYVVKTFILFTGCYRGICPEKRLGIWLVLIAAVLMIAAALLPSTPRSKNIHRPVN